MLGLNESLLAKSKRSDKNLTLEKHLNQTKEAAERIFRLDGRWGRNWCRFFKIYAEADQQRFLLNLRVAALFHDLGKANEDFLKAVSQKGFYQQSIRHEHLSALILQLPEIWQWLGRNSDLDLDAITAAVLSHHLKASDSGSWEWCQPKGRLCVPLYLQHAEVKAILARIAEVAGLPEPPALPQEPWTPESVWQQALSRGRQAAKNCNRNIRKERNPKKKSLFLAVKAGVIVADAVASALFRENLLLKEWVESAVHTPPVTPAEVEEEILTPFAKAAAKKEGKPFKLRDFQTEVARIGWRGLLLTACGSGKTRGAWEWLKEQCREREIGKLIFLYPTRATSLQGFLGYTAWGGEKAAHLTGTAQYELEWILENPVESTKGKDFRLSESEARLFALGCWDRRYFSGTVDQFMSFLAHNYKAMCLLPVLADAAIVLDEVHSYDRQMFESLIAFLRNFDIPVLCMTATLPVGRKQQLLDTGLVKFPSQSAGQKSSYLEEQENHPRYRLEVVKEPDALSRAIAAYQNGQRVLWVVNQVARCQKRAEELEYLLGVEVLSYHSQFKLGDRNDIHAATVAAFTADKKEGEQKEIVPAIAVTTQVCEMSLDLDADLLVTEIADICGLVQRFGRANRHRSRGNDFRAQLLVYPPENSRPYTKEEIESASRFLADLGRGDLSQRLLAEKLEHYAQKEPSVEGWTRFLSEGYYATPADFRDIDDYRKTCVLDGDLPQVLERIQDRRPFDDLTLGVRERYVLDLGTERPHWLPKWLGVAPSRQYCQKRGFWEKREVQNV